MITTSRILGGAAFAAAIVFAAGSAAQTWAPADSSSVVPDTTIAVITAGDTTATMSAAADTVPAGTAAMDSTATVPDPLPRPEMARFVIMDGDTVWVAETFEVVGSRVPAALPGAVRTVEVLESRDLERLPARSAAEDLQTVPGVSVTQRQQYGVQSDLSIRGSTFDQVQVLLNGFDAGDPQTGHHLMDLPLGRQDVARLEVLPGHGSALYGSGAFGGTVNVVSRRPAASTGGEVAALGGGNGTWGLRGALDVRLGEGTGLRLSEEKFKTDGYDVVQPDGSLAWGGNDAETWTRTGRLTHEGTGGEWDLFAGYGDREFGALDFYAPYPSVEHTRSLFLSGLNRRRISDRLTLEPRVFFRRHRDEFVLLRDDPEAFTNDHTTRKGGAELQGILDLGGRHDLAMSVEGVYEDIDSRGLRSGTWGEALGRHVRRRLSGAFELDRNGDRFRWQLGARGDFRPEYAPRLTGTGAVSVAATDVLTLRASAGNVYRLPTFTDLYYEDPANVGNPDLEPETAWTWDAGFDLESGPWTGRASYFERYETDRIEWVWSDAASKWQVMNIAEGTVRGVETRAGWSHPRGHGLAAGWSWLENDTRVDPDFLGKYTLLVPRHLLTGQGTAVLPWNLVLTTTGRYVVHNEDSGAFLNPAVAFHRYFVWDARLDWTGPGGWFAAVTGTNLLDRTYGEVPGVQMPGRLLTGTLGKHF